MDLSSRPITGFLPIFAVFELAALYLLKWLDSDTKLIVAVPSAFAAVSFSVLAFVFRKRAGRKMPDRRKRRQKIQKKSRRKNRRMKLRRNKEGIGP